MHSRADDWLLLGLGLAAALTFAGLLLRSRRYTEVTWVVHTIRHVGPPDAVRVLVDVANAGLRAADDVTVWRTGTSAAPRLEVARSSVRVGDEVSLVMDVPASDWDDTWVEIRWRSPRRRGRPRTTAYHLATRTPPVGPAWGGQRVTRR